MDARTRLLVVDDDPSVRAMLREYLEGHGFAVAEAGSGAQMRECIERELPDAVLLDIRLPGEDGLSLAQATCASTTTSASSWSRPRATSSTVWSGSSSAPTTTSPSPSIRASCWRA